MGSNPVLFNPKTIAYLLLLQKAYSFKKQVQKLVGLGGTGIMYLSEWINMSIIRLWFQ